MKKRGSISWILLLLVIISVTEFLPAVMAAETKDAGEGVYTLGEVVVSARQDVVETAGTVREVTAQDIQDKDARTLDQALELLPGVEIRTGAGGIPRIDIHGFRSRHVLLLLDGMPLNSTYDGQFDPSIIPTENIAKIKVSYGASSVLYGQGPWAASSILSPKREKRGFRERLPVRSVKGRAVWAVSMWGALLKMSTFS